MNQSFLGIGVCVLWLWSHAAFTFWAGGFHPGSSIANIFVAVDSIVSIVLAFLFFKLTRQ